MKIEIIDHLDEKRNVLGTIDKITAHKKGLWHSAVRVWMLNDYNQILLQKRCADKDFFPNVWDASFAGHVSAGEDSITTVVREGYEELGINIDLLKMEYLFTNKEQLVYKDIESNEFVDVYLLKQNINLEDIVLQKEEVEAVKYISVSEFIEMIDTKDETLLPHSYEYEWLKKYFIRKRVK